jgi:hypothetical protein
LPMRLVESVATSRATTFGALEAEGA